MIVKVKELFTSDEGTKWETVVSQGHQCFAITESYDKAECLWTAKMFRKALKAHDIATITKFLNDPRRK
jgi:hypothetical protein